MNRIPKFIRTDKVCSRKKSDGKVMFIEKFKTIRELTTNRPIYTGLVSCYWFEGNVVHKALFDEKDLEKVSYC